MINCPRLFISQCYKSLFCDRKNYIKKTPVVQILSYISTAGTEGHRSGGYSNITVSYAIMSVYFFGNDVKGYGCFCKSSRVPPCVPAACQGLILNLVRTAGYRMDATATEPTGTSGVIIRPKAGESAVIFSATGGWRQGSRACSGL